MGDIMKAQFPGKCRGCGQFHIHINDDIERHGGGWAAIKCIKDQNELFEMKNRIQHDMIERYNIALGCWGIPDSATATFTRNGFFSKALNLALCTQEEFIRIRKDCYLIWDHDLSD